jgi:hypothetical protein
MNLAIPRFSSVIGILLLSCPHRSAVSGSWQTALRQPIAWQKSQGQKWRLTGWII